jgi:PadR family transcriptional regulator PadR
MNELSKYPIIATKESTMYPLLRRLEKDNHLRSYWQETGEGLPSRKYYSITKEGEEYIRQISLEWDNLIINIENLRGGIKNG